MTPFSPIPFITTHEGNCHCLQAGRLTLNATKHNESSDRSSPRNNSSYAREKSSYQGGITVQYWNFLQNSAIQGSTTVYSSIIPLLLEMSGYPLISRIEAISAVNAFALQLQYTLKYIYESAVGKRHHTELFPPAIWEGC